jgi:pimeloyl-ACP methyl ester carboxylesterase
VRYPDAEVEFTSRGDLHDPDQQRAAIDLVRSSGATDVLVLVHGWNNDMPAARRLYERLVDNIATVADRVPGASDRRLAVVGVLWPSVRWADDDDLAGGGVGLVDEEAELARAIAASVDDPGLAAQLEELVPDLETSAAARERFLELLRGQIPPGVLGDEDAPPRPLLEGDAETVFDEAAVPTDAFDEDLAPGDQGDEGGAAAGGLGGAASFGDGPFGDGPFGGGSFGTGSGEDAGVAGVGTGAPDVGAGGAAGFGVGGILRGARSLLNLSTYYTMKARAGDVGGRGVASLVDALRAELPQVRVHLVGHSFGARVAVAATAASSGVDSVCLLQGAFSHNGLASDYDGRGNDGFFRTVLAPSAKVRGPIVVTHTRNDRAVGVAYAAASRLARQRASGFGGPNDVYGGIGRNGALKTPEATTGELLDVGASYDLRPGEVHNLKADRYIRSHSDVTGPQVAHAILHAVVRTG